MKTINEAVQYVIENIQKINPENDEIDEMIVRDSVEEKLLEKVEDRLTEDEMEQLDDCLEDDELFENTMKELVVTYCSLLEETAAEVIAEYVTTPQELEKEEE